MIAAMPWMFIIGVFALVSLGAIAAELVRDVVRFARRRRMR